MTEKIWKFKDPPDDLTVKALADSLNISEVLAKLLVQRNITNFFEAKNFFRPPLEKLHDPFLMDGMNEAAGRVIGAITNNEKICIYGDYDVDGTCAASLMYLFLKELSADVFIYIPNRLTEGYGISIQSLDYIKDRGATLLISVDCGITAVEEIDYANTKNIDVIICDHHKPKEILPKAYAILDPIKPGCNYPFKFLSGAGVAFKLTRAIGAKIGKKDEPLKYLDLVALAGAADIVPLVDENRTLVMKGLELINTNPRPGILALLKSARMEPGNLNAGQVVFSIAPRINAVGRLGDANRAVELFTTNDHEKAAQLAKILEAENYERRKIDEITYAHALELVDKYVDLDNDPAIILHDDNWHAGVIGIVASRLVEKFNRPAIMLTTIDGVAKGSARSITGVNIYDALEQCNDLLLQFGGHEAAAGVSIEIDKIEELKQRFSKILLENKDQSQIIPEIVIDSKITFSEITPKFVRILDQFAPFGPGNLRPTFLSEKVKVIHPPKLVGGNHLVLVVKQNGTDKIFDAIGFNLSYFANFIEKDKNLIDIVYSIDKIIKDGKSFPQLRIKDIKLSM